MQRRKLNLIALSLIFGFAGTAILLYSTIGKSVAKSAGAALSLTTELSTASTNQLVELQSRWPEQKSFTSERPDHLTQTLTNVFKRCDELAFDMQRTAQGQEQRNWALSILQATREGRESLSITGVTGVRAVQYSSVTICGYFDH